MKLKQNKGVILELTLIFGAIFLVVGVSFISWLTRENKLVSRKVDKELALQIAEAGINYYTWHLAHDEDDYTDNHPGDPLNGNGNYGPYIHEYFDSANIKIGEYSLEITPPQNGSTIVTIHSTGYTVEYPNIKRTTVIRVGKKSFSDFSFLTHEPIWIGVGEATSGKIHSNGGIRFDDTANAAVTSAVASYDCVAAGHSCSSNPQPGIWGSGGPASFWDFPVAQVDFSGVVADINDLQAEAIANGVYYDDTAPRGYHVTFKNNGTFDVRRVNNTGPNVWQYVIEESACRNIPEQIQIEGPATNHPIPSNGLIFFEDNVWIDGIVNGKVTLVSASLAAAALPYSDPGNTDVRINGNINYIARDGNHKLGIIAQRNIFIPKYAPANLTIDAALLAQKGHAFYRQYIGCSMASVKTNIEVYGTIITNKFWTWSYVNGSGVVVDGYQTTNTMYDNDLTFDPPPFFPTTGGYLRLSWEEE